MDFGSGITGRPGLDAQAIEDHYFSHGYSPFPRDRTRTQSYIMPCRQDSSLSSLDAGDGLSVDQLIGQRRDILATKLDVLTAQLHERLDLWTKHTDSLDYDDCRLGTAIHTLYVQSGRYIQGADRRMTGLQKQGFDITEQRREQDVECWRDVAMLTRDLLGVWEAYQKAKAKAELIRDVPL